MVGDAQQRSGGTGLGLVISRQSVRMMGSDIHVDSRAGTGNKFWFELDVPPVSWAAAELPAHEGGVVGYSGPTRRVLVVDDVPENRALLVQALLGDGAYALRSLGAQPRVQPI